MKNLRESSSGEPKIIQHSIEIPEAGGLQYEERVLELSDAVRNKYRLFGIEGYKIKTIKSLPPRLEQLSEELYQEVRGRLGLDLREQKGGHTLSTTELIEALNWMSYRLRRTEKFDDNWIPAEWYEQLFKVEDALTEGSSPSLGTVQHGMLGQTMGAKESYSGYDFEAVELLEGMSKRSAIFDKYNPGLNRPDHFRMIEGNVEAVPLGQESDTDTEVNTLWTSGSLSTGYHFSPIVFVYGNRNPVFKNYINEILHSEDPDIVEVFSSVRNQPEPSSTNIHYQLEAISDLRDQALVNMINSLSGNEERLEEPNKLFVPKDVFGSLQLLLERKPFKQRGDLKLPVVFNHPRLPDFRLGAMAESIINFAKREVIVPIAQE